MKRAKWETDPNFCKNVKKDFPMEHRDLLDFIDTAILDFLIGNADRHNYQDFQWISNILNLIDIIFMTFSLKFSFDYFQQYIW